MDCKVSRAFKIAVLRLKCRYYVWCIKNIKKDLAEIHQLIVVAIDRGRDGYADFLRFDLKMTTDELTLAQRRLSRHHQRIQALRVTD